MSTATASLRSQLVGRALTGLLRLARGDRGLHDESTLDDLARYVSELRPKIDALAERGRVPRDVVIEKVTDAPVPGEWVRPVQDRGDGPVVLHLHGGAYTLCSPATHRGMARALARGSRGVAFLPDYRLAPEHPFPAAVDDAVATYRWLLDEVGVDPARIAVTGDSAGGGLALALLVRARDEGLPMPACYAVALDRPHRRQPVDRGEQRPGQDVRGGAHADRRAARRAVRRGHLRPAGVAGLTGLPPMLVHVGEHELIRDDGLRLVERARAHGVDASAGTFAGMWHVFQVIPLPESRRSLREVGGFVRRHTASPT